MLKIYNSAILQEERREAASKINTALAFRGGMLANLKGKGSELAMRFVADGDIASMEGIRRRVMNAAMAPAAADIEAFFGRFFIDVTRRAAEAPDLTALIAQEITNIDFPELVYLRDLLKFRGEMAVISGANDPVPLIEQNTGETDTLSLLIGAVGWKDSIKNMLFNQFFTMQKVIQAAVDADVDARNAAIIGYIVAATFVASQKQAAIVAAGDTLDELTYKTFQAAIGVLRGLLDIQTDRKIAIPSMSILCNSADTDQIVRVIRGQLGDNGGGARGNVVSALPISNVIEYDHGINDGFTVGKKTLSYPGVTAGKCYLFVPGAAIVANKRPLTMETGMGSVLELSTEERAWYRVQGVYLKALMGSSYVPAAGGAAGYGNIVEVTLP
jgi:hypothetical protein